MVTKPRNPRPLSDERLSELAMAYVTRFATSRAKLTRYLERKLAERGWEGEQLPDLAALVEKLAGYGFVDDAAFAEAKARSLSRRGYGKRRVDAAVRDAGISEGEREGANAVVADQRLASALRYAERRRWGPWAAEKVSDAAQREKMIGAFLRAGHDYRLARAIVALGPGEDAGAIEAP